MPSHRAAEGVLILRVNLDGNTIKPPGNPTQRWTKEYLVNHVILYTSDALQMDHWDKFEIPLPSVMPGENAGNALLVLLVYDESSSLAVNFFSEIALHKPAAPTESTQAYFVAVQNQDIQQVFNLNPTSPQLPRTPAAISFDRFRATSDAAYERLAASYPLLCSQGSAVVTNSSVEQDYDVLDGVLPYIHHGPRSILQIRRVLAVETLYYLTIRTISDRLIEKSGRILARAEREACKALIIALADA
jgi:hypothetical protein